MKIKTVIYDLDDTLYSFAKPDKVATERMILEMEKRFGLTREEFMGVFSKSYSALGYILDPEVSVATCHSRTLRLQWTLERLGLPLFPAVLDLYEIYWGTILDNLVPEPYVFDTMKKLKEQNVRIGIGTNMTANIQFKKIDRLGLAPYVDFIVTSAECVFDKPDPRFFALCVEKAQCAPEEIIFTGDNYKFDVLGPSRCGIHGIWYDPERKWNPDFAAETGIGEGAVIHDHRELLSFIDEVQ